MKQLKIMSLVEPALLSDLAKQIEKQDIKPGDDVDVLFDSCGGAVDVAFSIADLFEKMEEQGVNLRAVAVGKVYSSAIVPFISIGNRVAQEGSSFLVHKAVYPILEDQNKDELRERVEELEAYTEELYDFYDDNGIVREVRKHLKEGDDLMLTNQQEIISAGFVPSFIPATNNLYTRFKRGLEQVFPTSPQFSYILNLKNLNQKINIMNSRQVEALFDKKFDEKIPDLAKAIAHVMNQGADPDDPEETPTNEVTALPETALNGLNGQLYGTPVTIDNNEEVKFLGHLGQNMASGGTLMPLNADYAPVALPDGDVVVKVGEEEFKMASNNGFLTMVPIPGNQDPETEPENDLQSQEPAPNNMEPAPAPNNNTPPAPAPRPSAAPQNLRTGVPPANNSLAQKAAQLYEQFPGATARK